MKKVFIISRPGPYTGPEFKLYMPSNGAAVVKWINHLPCKRGVAGSIPCFTSLSDETLSRGPVSI